MGILADVRAGAMDVLEGVKAANPTLIGDVYRARPGAFAFGPNTVYVGDTRADLAYNTSLVNWVMEVDIVTVLSSWDNEEWMDRAEEVATLIVDAFTADPHFVHPWTVGEPTRIRIGPEGAGRLAEETYPAVVVTVGRILYKAGRV